MVNERSTNLPCIWLTGLSGSGKSTTATALAQRLDALGHRVRILDGDAVRARFSPTLGYSRQDREANILRVAHMAREALDNGEIAICALISPYREMREHARDIIGALGTLEVQAWSASTARCGSGWTSKTTDHERISLGATEHRPNPE